jgi:hypothetical protein
VYVLANEQNISIVDAWDVTNLDATETGRILKANNLELIGDGERFSVVPKSSICPLEGLRRLSFSSKACMA